MVISMLPEIDNIIEKVKSYEPEADFEQIERAFHYALMAHAGQKRISGEPYIIHPVEVALIMTEIEADTASICAALLHDVVEDTDISYLNILGEFG